MPVAVALTAAAVALAVASPAAAGTDRITFGNVTCAPGWRAPNPGVARFAVANRSGHRATVYLFRAGSGAIVGQIRNSKPGSVRHLTVRLRPGSYAWGCALRGFPRHVSDAARVPVHRQLGGTGPAVVPLLSGELAGPLRTYRTYVAARIVALTPQVAALAAAVDSGNLAAAQSAWLTAHLTYLAIGQDDGAYGVFGELGRQIDGTAAGLVNGTADPRFTGFHKLELDLWRRRDLAAARPDATRLSSLVAELARRRLSRELPVDPAGRQHVDAARARDPRGRVARLAERRRRLRQRHRPGVGDRRCRRHPRGARAAGRRAGDRGRRISSAPRGAS